MISYINKNTINFLAPRHHSDTLINVSGTAIIFSIGIKCAAVWIAFLLKGRAAIWTVRSTMILEGKITLWTIEYASHMATSLSAKSAMVALVGTKVALGLVCFAVIIMAIALVAKLILKIVPPAAI